MARSSRQRSHQRNLVGFVVDGLHYAVPISAVKEIIRPLALVVVPHAPPSVVGVADHREAVVPVVDLRRLFGREPSPPSRRTKWVIISAGESSVGLVVDAMTDVFGVSERSNRPVPAWAEAQTNAGMGEVVSWNETLVFVLRPEAVVGPGLRAVGALGEPG